METKVGDYIIIDKHNKYLPDQKVPLPTSIFKFVDDKAIEILYWNNELDRNKIISYYPYNTSPSIVIALTETDVCKRRYSDEKFIKFLEGKGKDTAKNFYEAKKKYESLLKKRIKNAYTYHFVSFDNISFQRVSPSVYSGTIYSIHFETLLDGKSKKNSLTTHFYYKEKITSDYFDNDPYTQLVWILNSVMKKFEKSGLDKYNFYFDIDYDSLWGARYCFIHCVPMKPKQIDSNWFYPLSFYVSVLLEYNIKNIRSGKFCYLYDEGIFHKDMDCYDIMKFLIEKNVE